MGESKRRGNFEERRKQSIQRNNEKLAKYIPEGLVCNGCNSRIEEITVFDTKDLGGLKFACCGLCTECKWPTWGLVGDEKAVSLFKEYMTQQNKGAPIESVEKCNQQNYPNCGID
jgi:hypothetical protein